MKKIALLIVFILPFCTQAQFAFVMKVEYAMQVQNSTKYAVSGSILSGKIENNKTYYLDDGTKLDVKNIISAKSATSVPVALAGENVSISLTSEKFEIMRGETMRCISTRPGYGGAQVKSFANALPEGILSCKVNGKMYDSKSISKPVYMRQADVMDLFFEAENKTVIWIQINDFSQIKDTPHLTKSDTSVKERSLVCKLAYMPKGYRPTDMPNNYIAFEDYKGNAGVVITQIDRYNKKIALEFSGILRPNTLMLEEHPTAGLYYITEGRVDQIKWEEY
ncbi:MAG: hypothetical protein IPK62_01570 [Bacteroidetes bacterium]|nr:hypothetical protein [Bacteroidota bacterium]MBK8143764.1 hypothetical protein [Bacteroidota bacterium]MBP6315171.1 hypothetical protein [Chitinophagaceae bacterium]